LGNTKAKYTNKEIRLWVAVMAAILTVIGGIQYFVWAHVRTANVFWAIAAALFFTGMALPILLRPVYWVWLKIAAGLAWFNTRLIMFLIFYLVFTPVGLVLRLLRKDLIKQRWDKEAESYWIRRPETPFDPKRYENQY